MVCATARSVLCQRTLWLCASKGSVGRKAERAGRVWYRADLPQLGFVASEGRV